MIFNSNPQDYRIIAVRRKPGISKMRVLEICQMTTDRLRDQKSSNKPMLIVYLVAYLKWKYNIVIPGRARAMGSSFPGSHGFPVNLWPRSPSKPLTVVPVLVSLTRFSYLVVLIIRRLAFLVMIRLDF